MLFLSFRVKAFRPRFSLDQNAQIGGEKYQGLNAIE